MPPTSEEAQALHNVYLSSLQKGNNNGNGVTSTEKVHMAETKLEKTLLMFPQERKYVSESLLYFHFNLRGTILFSVHQKVFGGYLMRLAYEVGENKAA